MGFREVKVANAKMQTRKHSASAKQMDLYDSGYLLIIHRERERERERERDRERQRERETERAVHSGPSPPLQADTHATQIRALTHSPTSRENE